MINDNVQTLLDVNAAAGELRDLFAIDVTTTTIQCDWCEKTAPLAESYVYAMEPGLVVRCTNCESVLMRLVTSPGRAWVDMRGLRFMQMPVAVSS